eukprot:TRINITY_DN5484_c0_g1_i4.p2 TRINITY_DN5484_c0_g1~~TRINITY_DN5484_c0_g1_i4.p2  ORF type:complete len:111 (-),score=25.05 TRINITY_DN5484_c0_g1_i4:13-345(-)
MECNEREEKFGIWVDTKIKEKRMNLSSLELTTLKRKECKKKLNLLNVEQVSRLIKRQKMGTTNNFFDNNPIFNLKQAISKGCLLYTSPSPRDLSTSRMPSSACKKKNQTN